MSEGRYRAEPSDLVAQIIDLQRRLSSLEQNPTIGGISNVGTILAFGGSVGSVPSGYLVCDGAEVSRITYNGLFAVIGTIWGVGNGTTTFNLPNLINRVLVGAGGLFTVGSTGGADTHSHAAAGDHAHTNPSADSGGSHTHPIPQGTDSTSNVGGTFVVTVSHQSHTHGGTNSGGSHGHTIGNTGTTGSHSHAAASSLPAYGAAIPIIRY